MGTFSDARIREIVHGPRAFRVVSFPGTTRDDDVQVALRVLTEAEIDGCRVAAQQYVRAEAKKRGWKAEDYVEIDPHVLDRAIERQIVFRAFFDPETTDAAQPTRFFESPDAVRTLDSVTTTTLVSMYLEHQEWVSPLNLLPEEEVEALVEALGKGRAAEVTLARYAPSTLRRFVISLASALRGSSSPTTKSSIGSASDSDGATIEGESSKQGS